MGGEVRIEGRKRVKRERWEQKESKRESERKSPGQVSAWVARVRESCRALSEGKELVYCWYDTAALQRGKCEPSALLLLTRTKRTEWAHKHALDTKHTQTMPIRAASVTSIDFPQRGLFTEDIDKTSSTSSSCPQPLKNKGSNERGQTGAVNWWN